MASDPHENRCFAFTMREGTTVRCFKTRGHEQSSGIRMGSAHEGTLTVAGEYKGTVTWGA